MGRAKKQEVKIWITNVRQINTDNNTQTPTYTLKGQDDTDLDLWNFPANGGDPQRSSFGFESKHSYNRSTGSIASSRDSHDSRDSWSSLSSRNSRGGSNSADGSAPLLLLPAPCLKRLSSWRYVMVLLLHLSFVVSILQRNCMPIAMVCMADPSPGAVWVWETLDSGNASRTSVSVSDNQTAPDSPSHEFVWQTEMEGLILTAVSFSSFICPLLMDFVRPHLGNRVTLTLMTLLSSTLTLLTPTAARVSPWLLFAVRFVIGIFFGGTVTIMGDSFAWWAPALERQTMTSLTFAGVNVGGIITSVVTGYLCIIPVDNGWPFIFYVFGSLGALWCALWCLLSSQKPEDHRFISVKEKEYILASRVAMEEIVGKRQKPPYATIIRSPPVWALVSSVVCNSWTTNVYFTYLPAFFVTAFGFSVQQAGIVLSGLSAIRFVGHISWTWMSNLMLDKTNMTTTWARKIAICVGYWLSAVSQCCIIFLDEHHTWPVVVLVGVIMFNVAVGSCVATVLPLDIAPRYSGFLSGLAHSIGGLLSITGPLLVGMLTPNGTFDEWKIVWIVVTIVYLISGAVFLVFGDASLQPWGQLSRDSHPWIASPLVAMGRRFSAIMNFSPLTPVSFPAYSPQQHHPTKAPVSLMPNVNDEESDRGVK